MMQPVPPYPDVPGDNADEYRLASGAPIRPRIMARSGSLLGIRRFSNRYEAIWSFGFAPGSEAACAYEREMPEVNEPGGYGPLFVRATVRTGKILETYRGFALEMPASMRKVIDG